MTSSRVPPHEAAAFGGGTGNPYGVPLPSSAVAASHAFISRERGHEGLEMRDVALGALLPPLDEREVERRAELAELEPPQQHREVDARAREQHDDGQPPDDVADVADPLIDRLHAHP